MRSIEIIARQNGKYAGPALPGEMVPAACEEAEQTARHGYPDEKDGWWFVHRWLCSWLLSKAQDHHMTPETADRWIERYRAIRGVK